MRQCRVAKHLRIVGKQFVNPVKARYQFPDTLHMNANHRLLHQMFPPAVLNPMNAMLQIFRNLDNQPAQFHHLFRVITSRHHYLLPLFDILHRSEWILQYFHNRRYITMFFVHHIASNPMQIQVLHQIRHETIACGIFLEKFNPHVRSPPSSARRSYDISQ